MEKLERIMATLDEWQPSIQGTVNDIKLEISKTKLEISKISYNWERAILDQPATSPGVFAAAPATLIVPLWALQQLRPTGTALKTVTGIVDLWWFPPWFILQSRVRFHLHLYFPPFLLCHHPFRMLCHHP
jgi:hypothetical protein